jgi:hypothetical protein
MAERQGLRLPKSKQDDACGFDRSIGPGSASGPTGFGAGLDIKQLPAACFLTVLTLSGKDADMGTDDGEKTSCQVQIDPIELVDHGAPAAARLDRCRDCGRRHGTIVRCLPDGRWFDPDDQTWRDRRGRTAKWPDVVEYVEVCDLTVSIRLIHLSTKPKARPRGLCQHCRKVGESARNRIRRHLQAPSRRALGDLFLGAYDQPDVFERFTTSTQHRRGHLSRT